MRFRAARCEIYVATTTTKGREKSMSPLLSLLEKRKVGFQLERVSSRATNGKKKKKTVRWPRRVGGCE